MMRKGGPRFINVPSKYFSTSLSALRTFNIVAI